MRAVSGSHSRALEGLLTAFLSTHPFLFSVSQQLSEVDIIISTLLYIGKQRLRESKCDIQSFSAKIQIQVM